ncbi:MAG: toll/interleukin-1 receptor domain-containing protein, partial [Acidimicrobiia bacterium]
MEPPDRTHQGIATYDIFISFRGGDRELARRLRDALTRLSPARVFLDERSVLAGEQWAGAIEQAVQRSRAMIALVGPAWGLINDPGAVDWVRQELELALRVGVPILPVVVGEASRAKLADLAPAFTAQAQALRPEVPANQAELILLALARLGVRSVQPYSVDVRHVELDGTVRQQVLGALQSGNVIVCGNAGSGRSQLLAGLAAALATEPTYEHALVIGGRGRPIEAAARYAIVTNWFNELAALLRKVASAEVRQRVVSTCCANGGLLIRRGVLPARLLLDLTGGAADRQVVELLRRRSELGIMTQRSALIDEAVALLLAVPAVLGKKDLILLVDDYHELDSGSGIIVDRLAQHERVRVVATTSEPPPGRLVGTRIVLTPPVAADTSSVELGPAREYLDGLNRDRYLRALTLDHLIAEHSELETGDEAVRLSLPANPASSLSADRLIRHRLDQRITDRARAALSVGALMHNPFPFDTAYRVANAGSSVVEATAAFAALADADREGMLVRPLASEAGLCRVRFADDRVRSLLQAETPAGEHPALHQRIADLLEEDASRFADDLLISTWELVAYHRSQAEDHRRAAEAYRIAGRLAEQSVAGSAARRNYRRAVNALS